MRGHMESVPRPRFLGRVDRSVCPRIRPVGRGALVSVSGFRAHRLQLLFRACQRRWAPTPYFGGGGGGGGGIFRSPFPVNPPGGGGGGGGGGGTLGTAAGAGASTSMWSSADADRGRFFRASSALRTHSSARAINASASAGVSAIGASSRASRFRYAIASDHCGSRSSAICSI